MRECLTVELISCLVWSLAVEKFVNKQTFHLSFLSSLGQLCKLCKNCENFFRSASFPLSVFCIIKTWTIQNLSALNCQINLLSSMGKTTTTARTTRASAAAQVSCASSRSQMQICWKIIQELSTLSTVDDMLQAGCAIDVVVLPGRRTKVCNNTTLSLSLSLYLFFSLSLFLSLSTAYPFSTRATAIIMTVETKANSKLLCIAKI